MSERNPISSKNLDGYGNPELPWERVSGPLAAGELQRHPAAIGTVRPDGRPHAVRVGAIYLDGDFYFVSGAGSRKARNLAANPNCTFSVSFDGIDVSFEGGATIVDDSNLTERVAKFYREENHWPAEAEGTKITAPYNAPSAGPAPWNVYRFRFNTVFGGATAEPYGATRWRFAE